MSIIKTENLTKVYKDFWGRPKTRALSELNLEIHKGEIFGLLGPNGSGKTTALKLMLGLIFPTTGKVSVMGKPPRDISLKSKIGFMPEESYLYRFLNASETLCFYGQLLGLKGKELNNRVDRVLNIVGLDRVRTQPLREYSKGMSRRMGLAQVLLKEPELCVLDEPTIGLDPIGAGEIKDIIQQLKKEGTTVLFSTHLLSEAEPLCDRIGILYEGRLITMGALTDLLEVKDEVEVKVREKLEEFYIRTIKNRDTSHFSK
ncbi:MAG: ABC transporter ATP-binding protein [Candidatus Omnitrophica bacterium]|nr:ABC transporter ATP-binding protein [Candidatus Omnitrophota bacterium]